MGLVAFLFFIYLAFLIVESRRIQRALRAVPLRICVTGSRGKTGVVRMLAAVLREHGERVVAKTTGSETRCLLADGTEKVVRRRGQPSIMEQARLIRTAAAQRADALVVELMSLQPENHFVESRQIVQPQLVIVTNVRTDHLEQMGNSRERVANVLSQALPPNATVFVPEAEAFPVFSHVLENGTGRLVLVPNAQTNPSNLFPENNALVTAVCRYLGIPEETITRGIAKTVHDIGQADVIPIRLPGSKLTHYFVNAFAANDPDSTHELLKRLFPKLPEAEIVGLLCLRKDRADRTVQWLNALSSETWRWLECVYVQGFHARAAARKVHRLKPSSSRQPLQILQEILARRESSTIIIGMGNIGAMGKRLLKCADQLRESHGD